MTLMILITFFCVLQWSSSRRITWVSFQDTILIIEGYKGLMRYFSRCVHEYMDVYSEAVSGEAGELVTSPFGGRYCGPIPPRRRVSLHRAIAISFFTDKTYTPTTLFHGTYRFINDCNLICFGLQTLCFHNGLTLIVFS